MGDENELNRKHRLAHEASPLSTSEADGDLDTHDKGRTAGGEGDGEEGRLGKTLRRGEDGVCLSVCRSSVGRCM